MISILEKFVAQCRNDHGFSIMQVLIALGMMGVLTMFISEVFSNTA